MFFPLARLRSVRRYPFSVAISFICRALPADKIFAATFESVAAESCCNGGACRSRAKRSLKPNNQSRSATTRSGDDTRISCASRARRSRRMTRQLFEFSRVSGSAARRPREGEVSSSIRNSNCWHFASESVCAPPTFRLPCRIAIKFS